MHTRLGTVRTEHVVPKQRKLMGSSAQNSSGVHWCRRRVRFNEVPEKVPKVPARSGSTGFRKPSQVQQGSGRGSGEGSGGGRGGFGAEPGQVQQGSGEGSGEGLWGFGAEPGQVQQGSGSTGFRRRFRRRFRKRFQEALVQSQVRFNGLWRRLQKPSQVRFI